MAGKVIWYRESEQAENAPVDVEPEQNEVEEGVDVNGGKKILSLRKI